jgi:hypothetical protein
MSLIRDKRRITPCKAGSRTNYYKFDIISSIMHPCPSRRIDGGVNEDNLFPHLCGAVAGSRDNAIELYDRKSIVEE